MTCCLYYGIVIPVSFIIHDAIVPYFTIVEDVVTTPSVATASLTTTTTTTTRTITTNINNSTKSTFWLGVWFLSYALWILIWRLYFRKEIPIESIQQSQSDTITVNMNTHNHPVVQPTNSVSTNSVTFQKSQQTEKQQHREAIPSLLQPPRYPYIVLYEYCWLCNVTLIVTGGAWVLQPVFPISHTHHDRSAMILSYIILIGIDQLLWYIDLLLYIGTGHCPIGVAKYVFTSSTTSHGNHSTHTNYSKKNDTINLKHLQQQHWSNRVTWTHHLWTIPLVLYGCQYRIHFVSYVLSILYLLLNVTLSRYLIPSHIAIPIMTKRTVPATCSTTGSTNDPVTTSSSWTTPPSNDTTWNERHTMVHRYELYYLNINLSYEVYKDVQHIPFLRISSPTATMPWYRYLLALSWRWQCFNTIVYFIYCGICQKWRYRKTFHPCTVLESYIYAKMNHKQNHTFFYLNAFYTTLYSYISSKPHPLQQTYS